MLEQLSCDLLVVGGGMAGLSAAARAAECGARVIIVEKAAHTGGSAALSGGIVWTLQSARKLNFHARGRPELGVLVVEEYPEVIRWLRSRDVEMSQAMPVLRGRGYQIDILGHLRDCALSIEKTGGHVALSSTVRNLIRDESGAVCGAVVSHADGDVEIRSPWVLLATGGFSANPEMLAERLHPNARNMRLRSNPFSDGGGIRLGLSVGGIFGARNRGFYGHLVADGEWGDPRMYAPLTQYHSEYSLLINEQGERFCDESEGDHVCTFDVLVQSNARALLVWDARIHRDYIMTPLVAVASPLDKMELALKRGAEGAIVQSLDEIGDFASRHGFHGEKTVATIKDYNRLLVEGWEQLTPPRVEEILPVNQPPFYLLVVHPAVTFTYDGLVIDTKARALDTNQRPIAGLLVAGADAGDVYGLGYAGGLSLAAALGLLAARTAGYG